MIIFVGEELKGSWLPEISSAINETSCIVHENYHIEQQINEILAISDCTYIIFDVSQYIDSAETIALYILRICQANNATPIILASGYLPNSGLILTLIEKQIKYYIFASDNGPIKEEFLKCVNGYYEANGIDFVEDIKENIDEIKYIVNSSTLIGIGGIKSGIGTTTQCLQLVQYIQFCGYTAAYLEMNDTGYVRQVLNCYEEDYINPELGQIRHNNIDMFDRQEKIADILQLGYNFYVYDYGVYNSADFNKTSFLQKNVKIFVVGSKPNELPYTTNILRSLFYQDVSYIFNFTPQKDRDEILEDMEEKADHTYFSDWTVDPFSYGNSPIYSQLLPLDIKKEIAPSPKKGFFRFMKKR